MCRGTSAEKRNRSIPSGSSSSQAGTDGGARRARASAGRRPLGVSLRRAVPSGTYPARSAEREGGSGDAPGAENRPAAAATPRAGAGCAHRGGDRAGRRHEGGRRREAGAPASTHARVRSPGRPPRAAVAVRADRPGLARSRTAGAASPGEAARLTLFSLPRPARPAARPGPRRPRRRRHPRLRRPLGAREAPGSLRRLAGRGARSHNAAHGASLKRDHDGGGAGAPRSDRSAGERGQSSDGEYAATPAPQRPRASGRPCRAGPSRPLPGGRRGPPGSLEAEAAAVAWRRILHPTFLSPPLPLFPGLPSRPRGLAPQPGDAIRCCRKGGFVRHGLRRAPCPTDGVGSRARGARCGSSPRGSGRGQSVRRWAAAARPAGMAQPGCGSQRLLRPGVRVPSPTCSRRHVEGQGGREGNLWDQGHWGKTLLGTKLPVGRTLRRAESRVFVGFVLNAVQ